MMIDLIFSIGAENVILINELLGLDACEVDFFHYTAQPTSVEHVLLILGVTSQTLTDLFAVLKKPDVLPSIEVTHQGRKLDSSSLAALRQQISDFFEPLK